MTLPLAILGVAVAGGFILLAWLWVRRRGNPPVPGVRRCRPCRGTGAVAGADSPSGYGMCLSCNGTGWVKG